MVIMQETPTVKCDPVVAIMPLQFPIQRCNKFSDRFMPIVPYPDIKSGQRKP